MTERSLAHFRIGERLGAGGMGEVYRATDTRLGREVAVKILPERLTADAERLARFEREARAVASLNHPNIVTVHALEEDAGVHFIAMELVDGETLDELVSPGGMDLHRFFEIAVPLVDALAAAHERGVVHRDLKPANVMVSSDGRVKVLDFGLAKLVDEEQDVATADAETAALTRTGVAVGTAPYMSPEQIKGGSIDHRSDLFALGAVIYEMLTGVRAFAGDSAGEVVSAILRDAPPSIERRRPELPGRLIKLLERCLQKDPRRRSGSAAEVRDELSELAREQRLHRREQPSSIAVLPFTDMSPQKDQDYFCEGMAEEIISRLAKIDSLHVAARTASFQFREAADVAEIGKRLRVETVLEGSVRKAGNRLRVTAQLIKVADGYQLWSETSDRELEDVFAVQDEIAENVARALKIILTSRERQAIHRQPAADLEAYEHYLKGRKLFHRGTRKEHMQARALFERAAEVDPHYALAYTGIADASAFLYMYFDPSPENLTRTEEASRKALELAPRLAEAHASRGSALSLNRRYEEAEKEFETALRLDPKLYEAYYLYARDAWIQGKREKAVRLFEEAARVRPEDYQSVLLALSVYQGLGDDHAALTAARTGLERASRHLELNPDDARAWYLGAAGWVHLGERERAIEWARRAREIDPDDAAILYNVTCIYSLLGEIEMALESLEGALAGGYGKRKWIEHDADLDPLRDHPRFQELLERLPES